MTSAAQIGADPIVIAGIGVEAPGGIESPAQLWSMLADARETVGPLPRDREWPVQTLLTLGDRDGWGVVPDAGGFLSGAADFDPRFFGITPREARAMDPQQRVAMRVAWRAVEDAGINPAGLVGHEVGCFMGVSYSEYGPLAADVNELSGHRVTGTALGAVAGRISHALGLVGPSMSVDTACASSLTAVQLAAGAVLAGDCEWALAGAVCVMGSPGAFFEFSKQNALAYDGHCRSYSADATGTVWGEGAGVLVVEKRSRAEALGHRIHGEILAVRTNHNGRGDAATVAPIVVPSRCAQQRLIERTVAAAGVRHTDVAMIEGHGTATPQGDPLELTALQNTYGVVAGEDGTATTELGDSSGPLVGSIKSNVGHAQAASGILGLIKVLLCGRHGQIAPSLHTDNPTAAVDWSRSRLRLATKLTPFTPVDAVRYAAVSSFGVAGSNAHAIIAIREADNV